jgi:hypothetical protein
VDAVFRVELIAPQAWAAQAVYPEGKSQDDEQTEDNGVPAIF